MQHRILFVLQTLSFHCSFNFNRNTDLFLVTIVMSHDKIMFQVLCRKDESANAGTENVINLVKNYRSSTRMVHCFDSFKNL